MKSDNGVLYAVLGLGAIALGVSLMAKKAPAAKAPAANTKGIDITTVLEGGPNDALLLAQLNYQLPEQFTIPANFPKSHVAVFMQAYNGSQKPVFTDQTFIADLFPTAIANGDDKNLTALTADKGFDEYFNKPYIDQILAAEATGGKVLVWTASSDYTTGKLLHWWLTDWTKSAVA